MRASGQGGTLCVGYQHAAYLGPWTLTLKAQLPRAYEFATTVRRANAYWIRQRPLDLVIEVGHTEWRWRDVAPPADGQPYVIELRDRPIVSERVVAQQGERR